ncbi:MULTISPECIES: SDR family oxidoreductase [unclassified Xanthobacter]|uniref:SDR family oxidoreductase n=1 Tax=unclassified Xanthobacter TaxID=2623496 RepID=UPI001EE07E51|nr:MULTISPECIES: SDR family oxidoreductase [unclassified Xanthobacter]
MDLGISGRKAIVCASSRGLGKACATALAQAGCAVTINGRTRESLDEAQADILAASGRMVQIVQADINTAEGRAKLLAACPDADILVNNNDGPPPGKFMDWEEADFLAAINANMLAATFMIKGVLPGMRARRFGRIVNITSAMVKSPRLRMGLSTASRTALTALCKALSVDCAADNVTINNMLPERFDTGRQVFMAKKIMAEDGIDYEAARKKITDTIAARRFGRPEEFGDTCAFLCSVQAGFISGQSLQLDGGSYPGLF